MEERAVPSRSLEDILKAVEQDETLRAAENVSSAAEEGATPSGGVGGLAGIIPPELMLRLPTLIKAVQRMTEPVPVSDHRPETPVALLCALRPYLNERRRRAVDTMIRISRLGDTLGHLR